MSKNSLPRTERQKQSSARVKRLYDQFQPERYELAITPAGGTVTIRGKKIGRPSQRLTFHQKDLKIKSARIIYHGKNGDEEVEIERINRQQSFDEVRLHSKIMLYPGSYTVSLDFESKNDGSIPSTMEKYIGSDKPFIPAQLGNKTARKFFPCIDEPEAASMLMIESNPHKTIEYKS